MAAVSDKSIRTYEVTCSECGAHWIFACSRCAGRVFEDSEAAAQSAAADHEAHGEWTWVKGADVDGLLARVDELEARNAQLEAVAGAAKLVKYHKERRPECPDCDLRALLDALDSRNEDAK